MGWIQQLVDGVGLSSENMVQVLSSLNGFTKQFAIERWYALHTWVWQTERSDDIMTNPVTIRQNDNHRNL